MGDGQPTALRTAAGGGLPMAFATPVPAAPDMETAGLVRAQAASSLSILHIFRAPLGGLFRHVVDLVQGQAARGHRVGLIVDSTTGGARAEAALAGLSPHLALGGAARGNQPRARSPGRSRLMCCTATAPRARRWRD
jgi:hypothetical protein